MDTAALQQFKSEVALKFQLYNSLFTSLPFHRIEKTGILLSMLLNVCEEGYKKMKSPVQIMEEFFSMHTTYRSEQEQTDLLFRFVQYVERQVVLFDALEDAAFSKVNDLSGPGTLKQLKAALDQQITTPAEGDESFCVKLVLTAHPTQFYPGAVLGIINDLSKALQENNTTLVNTYLQQLGKTPFFKKQKPTPYDEAMSLVWYLDNVFYPAVGKILTYAANELESYIHPAQPLLQMGFWPGGDRDGNPFVTAETTLQVAASLRSSIVRSYYIDVRRLKRRLTFKETDQLIAQLEKQLYNEVFAEGMQQDLKAEDMISQLKQIRDTLVYQHNGLFANLVDNLIQKMRAFGLYYAALDVRQDSSVHESFYKALSAVPGVLQDGYDNLDEGKKLEALSAIRPLASGVVMKEPIHADTLKTIDAIRQIQQLNGEAGCHRYIISQCNKASNVMEVFGLFLLGGWNSKALPIDIVPLFETIDDLHNAGGIMEQLYSFPVYREHLKQRGNRQTIMLGFSDGTKDGGYLMANYSILLAKQALTKLSEKYNVDVLFFDGRGGPPARGGGKTQKFYASMGNDVSNKEIQLTIQGQTISSNFGTIDSAQYNMEQLLNAGLSGMLRPTGKPTLQPEEEALLRELADDGYQAYVSLKEHPFFVDYLAHASPLRFYAETNIGSRPAKRGSATRLSLKDLRAIPFVGAWSQLKQNVTGYYGVGTALQAAEKRGEWKKIKALYQQSLFFRTLIDNCEMAMLKCYFPLTTHLGDHPSFGEIWHMIYSEYELTRKYLFLLSGKNELMADYPVEQLSVQMRERIVLPLTTIQQFAITRVREMEGAAGQTVAGNLKAVYEKLVMRCSFGIINAGRNSA
ncbi:phosphoenolpyruvate carboxylase [Flavihumibacter petaseus]|uniref:Phosphoenolpyruvate carboxylase n=1 Tax=Flavihumibacter petaseus NBRC 106054 TaxID=1220578 RepID=A0A0E9MUA9_9BACT|nr:phosphoenolpyruvate carboxylase [Flavihumibacter petaseus]GAO41154.1 phosphoenolpyruvate carboxylase [Flavihumibacter petaseus NBRC 106054]